MRKKIFTILLALAASIGMMWAETVVVINKSEFTSSGVTKEGVTLALSSGSMTSSDPLAMDGSFEFSTSLGKFTGITIETDINIMEIYEGAFTSAGWPTGDNLGTSAVWTGESETVFISCMVAGMDITITCTIEPAPVLADCGLGWLNVPEGGVVGTIGHEDEIVLPQVNASLDFILAFQAHTATLRLGSTDESVLAVYGFNNFAVNGVGECDVYVVHDEDAVFAYDSAAFHVTVNPEPAPQPEIGPKEVLDLGTTGCVGEHYQLTGGGTNIYRTVGGVDNKMITIESLHGEIIDNISLKLYYYNVWTGYSVAASSGDVSSWNYDAYEDLVITNINATSVTLSRVGSGQENGYVMFEKVTINNSDEPQPQPAEDVDITPNVDPENPTVYYSTFFDSSVKYELPAGVEAYVADLSGANLLLTKIAEAGEVIPANVAVILKSTVTPFTLTVSDADAVTFTANNDLQGSDTQIATPDNCYVLAGTDGVVGFYHYTAANLNAHKAYVVYSGSNQAPRRMPFIFDQATGVENVQGDNVQSTKVIENGVLYIIKNGVKYNAQGQKVK